MNLAIIDLGSNSFKIEVSRASAQGFKRLDSLKKPVRFIAGIDAAGNLSAATRASALDCLSAFRRIVDQYTPDATIAIATESLRRLNDSSTFIHDAEEVLGHPIRILTGAEEAKLCYAGVESLLGVATKPRLVMDIGGGSTQYVLGDHAGLRASTSVPLGCVVLTRDFFADQTLSDAKLAAAVSAAKVAYTRAWSAVNVGAPQSYVGASGAFRTVLEASANIGHPGERITRAGVESVQKRLLARGHFSAEDFPSVPVDRHPVFVACFALVRAIFEVVQPSEIAVCKSGLRMGLLAHLQEQTQLVQALR
jgi:exopolyphosphatase / guanosine-5'-triphosphate,3'-diphosphate pyrophosphatase